VPAISGESSRVGAGQEAGAHEGTNWRYRILASNQPNEPPTWISPGDGGGNIAQPPYERLRDLQGPHLAALYPGASTVKNCRSGGQTSIDIQLTNSAVLTVRPAYIDRHDGLSLGLLVASGTTLRLVSDKARIETSHELVLVPLQYQGSVGEIAPADRQDGYDLKGRPQYYLFHVPEGDVKGDHFALILPIILDPERNLDMVRVQFDRRTAYCVVGMQ